MLSNTATPKYYGEFRERVLAGEIPVCQEISMQMNRIDEKIANPAFFYDDKAIEGYIAFCENELTLTDGSDMILLDTFKLWAEDLLSWFYFEEMSVYVPDPDNHGGHYERRRVKKRLTKKQFLIVGRGAAKTLYLESIHADFLVVDRTTTDQIATSPTERQSEETLRPLITAITRARGPLFQFLTEGSLQNTTGSRAKRIKLCSTKKGIQNFLTNSILRIIPMKIDRLQGLRTKVNTVDEWLSCDIKEDPIGAIEQGASKIKDYVIIAASSEGTIRNGVGDSIKMELMDILRGDYPNPTVSIFWYKLDDVKEVADPAMWMKAQPNIGTTVSYSTYQEDVERAEHNPVARNDILAKRFGLPMEGYTYFFTYEETLPSRAFECWGLPCAMGADLSQGDDFCAFTFLFPLPRGRFGVKTRCYVTSKSIMKLPLAMRAKYEEFINEGSLHVMEGNVLDMEEVYDDLDRYIDASQYDVVCLGYDPYNAKYFIDRWEKEHGPYGIEKVIQGVKTESVPLGELKHLAEERALVFDQEMMVFTMGNCITIEDTNGNRKLLKARYERKIDSVAALMDAFVSFKIHKENFE